MVTPLMRSRGSPFRGLFSQTGLGDYGGGRAVDYQNGFTVRQAGARSDSAVACAQRLRLGDEAVPFGQPSHGLLVSLLHAVENGVELHAGIVHWATLAAIEEP